MITLSSHYQDAQWQLTVQILFLCMTWNNHFNHKAAACHNKRHLNFSILPTNLALDHKTKQATDRQIYPLVNVV